MRNVACDRYLAIVTENRIKTREAKIDAQESKRGPVWFEESEAKSPVDLLDSKQEEQIQDGVVSEQEIGVLFLPFFSFFCHKTHFGGVEICGY